MNTHRGPGQKRGGVPGGGVIHRTPRLRGGGGHPQNTAFEGGGGVIHRTPRLRGGGHPQNTAFEGGGGGHPQNTAFEGGGASTEHRV